MFPQAYSRVLLMMLAADRDQSMQHQWVLEEAPKQHGWTCHACAQSALADRGLGARVAGQLACPNSFLSMLPSLPARLVELQSASSTV